MTFKTKQAVDGLLCVFSLAYHSEPILIFSFAFSKNLYLDPNSYKFNFSNKKLNVSIK